MTLILLKNVKIGTHNVCCKQLRVQFTTTNTQVCVFYNKGKCKNDSDHVSSGILYQHCCSYCFKETKKRFEHPVNQCMRLTNGNSKTETGTVKLTNSVFNKVYTNLSMAIENNIYLNSISQFANDKSVVLESICNQKLCDNCTKSM